MIEVSPDTLLPAEASWRRQMAELGFPVSVEGHAVHSSHLTSATADYRLAYEYTLDFSQSAPDSILAWSALSTLSQRLGRPEWAQQRRRLAELVIEESGIPLEDHPSVIEFYLACEGATQNLPGKSPASYVKALFNRYAAEFDEDLLGDLNYAGHSELAAAIARQSVGFQVHDVLDLGCGTGLLGDLLRRQFPAASLVGVDIAPQMLDQATGKQIYDKLVESEIESFLQQSTDTFDLIAASDVFTYFGDLDGVLEAIVPRLAPGGICAFTTLSDKNCETYRTSTLRDFRHSPDYVSTLLKRVGLPLVFTREITLREHLGNPLFGTIFVCKKE